jgi:uncharacterized membrane protein YjgN (DUF898 family)
MSEVVFSPAEVPPDPSVRPKFTGDGRAFLKLMFKGAMLQLVTLGFYRFWFVTDIRRRLWSDTSIDGDALEYTGRGRELLIGFLFALAILAPFYVLYFLAGLEAERLKAFAGAPLFLAFYLFGQFAAFRARRYRLTRTIWRGVRFWMTGSGVSYALRSFGWTLLTVVTLGLALPWRAAALERYKMRHSRYGELRGRFEATGWQLFKAGGWIWLVGLIALLGPWITLGLVWYRCVQDDTMEPEAILEIEAITAVVLTVQSLVVLLWPIYQAIEWRWWLGGLRLGDVRFSSNFPRFRIVKLWLGMFAALLAALLGAGLIAGVPAVGFARALRENTFGAPQVAILVYLGLAYLVTLMAIGAFYRYIFQFRLWDATMKSLTLHGLSAAANVAAIGEPSNALGEGLADGLEFAGF